MVFFNYSLPISSVWLSSLLIAWEGGWGILLGCRFQLLLVMHGNCHFYFVERSFYHNPAYTVLPENV